MEIINNNNECIICYLYFDFESSILFKKVLQNSYHSDFAILFKSIFCRATYIDSFKKLLEDKYKLLSNKLTQSINLFVPKIICV